MRGKPTPGGTQDSSMEIEQVGCHQGRKGAKAPKRQRPRQKHPLLRRQKHPLLSWALQRQTTSRRFVQLDLQTESLTALCALHTAWALPARLLGTLHVHTTVATRRCAALVQWTTLSRQRLEAPPRGFSSPSLSLLSSGLWLSVSGNQDSGAAGSGGAAGEAGGGAEARRQPELAGEAKSA